MRTLSFDTSNPFVTVALMEDGKIVSSRVLPPSESGRQEAVSQLMPTIDDITAKNSWSRDSIDLIIVGVGPGSFTGMRTCVVTARTLAQVLDIGLIGIDALRCYASQLPLPSTIVLSGGRGHYFIGSYSSAVPEKQRWEPGDANMKIDLEPTCLVGDEFIAAVKQARSCFVEEKILDEVRAHNPDAQAIPANISLAVVQAELANSDFGLSNKDRDKLKTIYAFDRVNPLYLRGASITLKPNAGEQAGNRN